MFPDALAHGCVFLRVLALPPLEIVQVTAEGEWRTFDDSNGDAFREGFAAFIAYAGANVLRFNRAMPGNATISRFVKTGSVDGADGFGCARVPVLTICPVVSEHSNAANLAEGRYLLVGLGIAPDATVAAVKAACTAVIRAAVGHPATLARRSGATTTNLAADFADERGFAKIAKI